MSNYVTAIGLDVPARSIKACALNPMTGEVERASFGYDPASVAEWALSFESPKAIYEPGVNGFHLCRALRVLGLDCAVGAVSKMQRPAAASGPDLPMLQIVLVPGPERMPRRVPQLRNRVCVAMIESDEGLDCNPSLFGAEHAASFLSRFGPGSPPQSQTENQA